MSSTAELARAIARENEAMVRRIVAEELRRQTGVVAGGPYNSFTVRADGRIDWAGQGARGCGLYFAGTRYPVASDDSINVSFNHELWDDGDFFESGSPTDIILPRSGRYLLTARASGYSGTAGGSGASFALAWTGISLGGSYALADITGVQITEPPGTGNLALGSIATAQVIQVDLSSPATIHVTITQSSASDDGEYQSVFASVTEL